MKKTILILVSLLSLTLNAQTSEDDIDTRANTAGDLNVGSSGLWVKSPISKKIKGTPYLFKKWVNLATISSNDGKTHKVKNINYDTKIDRFVSKFSLDSVFVFDFNSLNKIRLNNKVFKLVSNNNVQSYYELIAFTKGKEILKKSSKLIKKGARDAFTNQFKPDQYILKETYYLKSENIIKKIKLKNTTFLKIFGNKSPIIKKYIKKNKLSIKNDEDLAKIFQFYENIKQ
ncbi:hypothetical protein [uncultured Polaribacter sp.]|uniref:hypothetical protein n=1 Tax=uncultured Polaribacter sp. TaxID=174711 RepID=UPI00260C77A6|nr:hypothetical protein [uncultured Polaribacter sp.]